MTQGVTNTTHGVADMIQGMAEMMHCAVHKDKESVANAMPVSTGITYQHNQECILVTGVTNLTKIVPRVYIVTKLPKRHCRSTFSLSFLFKNSEPLLKQPPSMNSYFAHPLPVT